MRKGFLLLIAIVLLTLGGTILYRQLMSLPVLTENEGKSGGEELDFRSVQEPSSVAHGRFSAQSVERYVFTESGKDVFDLLVSQYRDDDGKSRSVVLFPKDAQAIASTPTGWRHDIWQSAADIIALKAPEDALFLSWWDDGQRIHFLSGKKVWLQQPSEPTFVGPVWKALKPRLTEVAGDDGTRLAQMARWLTMDSEKAIAEIVSHFGTSRPVYLLVDNDLLLHLAEFSAYGGTALTLNSKSIPAGNDLHGDIARVKHWAIEAGDGNYLAQKEGNYYRLWSTADQKTKNTLLVRLLPFVDSLKKLPEGVSLVYQSHWGGFLSVYKVDGPSIP